MGQEAWAQGLCSAHYYRSPHQHHHSVWVVVPTASVNLEIILSALWHGPPWITAASEVDLLMGPPCPPTAENSHSGAGNHRLFLTGPGPAHCSATPSPLESRPPAVPKTLEFLERTMPSPPLQLCQGHVFCTRSSSSRQWKDVRTWPHGQKVMSVLTIWN